MTILEVWVGSPLAAAGGWTLLHSLGEGAIIPAALAAFVMAMGAPPARYHPGVLAMVVMVPCCGEAPMVLANFGRVIRMPLGLLAGLPAGQIEAILLHERAHSRRYDYLINVLQRWVEGLLFYHPAVWWISRVIRAERENCCDDVVVATSGNAHEYAVALAALEQNRWSGRKPAVAATGGSLVKRIHRLLYPKGPYGAWTPLFAAVILMAAAAVALVAWQVAPPQN